MRTPRRNHPARERRATIDKLAINAVMAGCLPEYFPVVIAALRARAEPDFDLLGIQTTTNPVAPVLVINGPIREQIGINCGRGCMGPDFAPTPPLAERCGLPCSILVPVRPATYSNGLHASMTPPSVAWRTEVPARRGVSMTRSTW